MRKIEFSDKNAGKLYQNYIDEVKKAIKTLPLSDQEDILLEMNSHIYESLNRETPGDEKERLATTLQKLGEPKVILSPLVAERKLSQATQTFNPVHILKALLLNFSNGFIYILFSILYLFIFCFVFLIVVKLISPESVGLFVGEGELHFGWTNIKDKNLEEVLGGWFIPIVILLTGVFYLFTTFLLRLKYKLNSKK